VVWVNVGRVVALTFVLLFVYVLFVSDIFPIGRTGTGQSFDPEMVRAFVQSSVDENKIRDYLERLTAYDHVAGTEGDYVLTKWVEELFTAAKLEQVELKEYVQFSPVLMSLGNTLLHPRVVCLQNFTKRDRRVLPCGLALGNDAKIWNILTSRLLYGTLGSCP
jgi:hypothetical protein